MKKRLLLVTALLWFVAIGYAQNEHDIDELIWKGEAAPALQLINKKIGEPVTHQETLALHLKKAECLVRLGKLDDASLELSRYASVIDREPPETKAAYHTTLGFLWMSRGRNDLALESLEQALQRWAQSEKKGGIEETHTQALIGNLFRTTGKYTQAEEQLSIALLTRQKRLPENHELIAASYNDLGLVFSFTDKTKALEYYENALALYTTLHGERHPKIAIAKTNIGVINAQLEFYGDAILDFETALSIWESVHSVAHPTRAFVLYNLGNTYQQMKDNKTARLFYEQSLKMYEDVYKRNHPDIARLHNALGNLALSQNQMEEALIHFQQALHANSRTFTGASPELNPTLQDFYDGNVLLYSLLFKAQALETRYLKKTLRFKDLTLALSTLQTCDSLIEKLRQRISSESDKIILGATSYEVYADGVRISMLAAQAAWTKKPWLELAFHFAERSKAAVLMGALSEANAKSFAGIPPALLEEERDLKSSIALCAQKLSQKPAPDEEQYLRQTLYELNRQLEQFTKRLETDFPSYYNLKYNTNPPSVRALQQKLDNKTLLLNYFIDEKNNQLYIFNVSANAFTVDERRLPPSLDRLITGLRNSIYFSEITTYLSTSTALSSVLLPRDIKASITDLLVIPSGKLGTIPFEALLNQRITKAEDFSGLPYLLKRFSVRYEFSAGLILQKTATSWPDSPSILLCAPIRFADKSLPALPGTAKEVNGVASLFRERNLNELVLKDSLADEGTIKNTDLSAYNFIHFATHGVVDQQSPDLSKIYLHSSGSLEDGNLYASEIYNLTLNANLVTLSACQTGLGKIAKGEGVIGLSRALKYAGAQRCVVSFWSVADESTSILMQQFYHHLLNTGAHNVSATLRKAKLDVMKQSEYAEPFYWAPFIMIGF